MQKIISLFQRNYETDRLVRNEVVQGAEWVLAGEGVPTRKWDGNCCMMRGGNLYKRYELKKGKTAPSDFEPAGEVDENTGNQVGWRPVGQGPEDQWFRAAFKVYCVKNMPEDGTYEAIGPHFGGGNHDKNPEEFSHDTLVRHGVNVLDRYGMVPPRDFDGLKAFFSNGYGSTIEGVVWWHPDGRMVKIKQRDFGLKRRRQ